MAKKIIVSLFAGAGGLDLGFEQAGFDVRVAVEMDPNCCRTMRQNHPQKIIIEKDVKKVSSAEILKTGRIRPGTVFAVIGGPPCQGFSQIGKRDPRDPRNFLYREFLRIVEGIKPSVFLMENTSAITFSRNREVFQDIIVSAQKAGYATVHQVLKATDFGVPQRRQRCFISGVRRPQFDKFMLPGTTVGECFRDILKEKPVNA